MPKLHELLAVDNNLKGQLTKVITELSATFSGKRHHFEETRKVFRSLQENSTPVVEEQKDIQTTVASEIEWISGHIARAWNAGYQIDVANTKAFADVVLESDDVILKQVPTTALLQLEKRLKELQQLIATIPTLDPAKGFQPDPDHRMAKSGVYKAREVVKTRTRKAKKAFKLAEATDKHPAQVQMIDEDEPVGTILEQEWSSMITPSTKAEILDRVEQLTRAVSKARARANEQDVDVHGERVGKKLLDWVFQPLSKEGKTVE